MRLHDAATPFQVSMRLHDAAIPCQVSMRLRLAMCLLFQLDLAAASDPSPSPPPSPPPPSPPPPYAFASRNALDGALDEFNDDAASAIAEYGPIADWDVSAITDMSELFKDMTSFNADISGWNTAGVIDMSRMFQVCSVRASAPTWIHASRCLISRRPDTTPCSRPPHHTTPHPRHRRARLRSTSR